MVNEHREPEADFPVLKVSYHVGVIDTMKHCYQWVPLWMKLLGGVPLGCAEFNFKAMTCEVYMATDSEWIREHEDAHCTGRDHYADDSIGAAWRRYQDARLMELRPQ